VHFYIENKDGLYVCNFYLFFIVHGVWASHADLLLKCGSRGREFYCILERHKQHYTPNVFKLYYFSCQLTSVMHYNRIKNWKEKMKKLYRANESNKEIQAPAWCETWA
jgi:hypothetical protein